MRPERSFLLAATCALLTAPAAYADPETPKFWVQVNDDNVMFHDLLMGDHRINPLIVVRTPSLDFSGPPMLPVCPGDNFCPEFVACNAKRQVEVLTAGMTPPSGGFPIAILILGFGGGGRSQATQDLAFHFTAPALMRPPNLNLQTSGAGANLCPPGNNLPANQAIPGSTPARPNNDYVDTSACGTCPNANCPPWWSPWPDLGPTDCADWLRAFATRYSELVRDELAPSRGHLASDYQPKRLVLDNEDDIAPVFANHLATLKCNLLADPSRSGIPVKGMPFFGTQSAFDGPSITALANPNDPNFFAPPCDNCNGDAGASARLWQANINRQAQVAALFRAVESPDFAVSPNQSLLPPILSFLHGSPPLWTNFGFCTTNGQIDPTMPPYDKNGAPMRKVAYRDRLYYETYKNFANFSSPVSYGFSRNHSSDLAGASRGDWVLFETRNLLDSIVFSAPRTNGHVAFSPEAITPWI